MNSLAREGMFTEYVEVCKLLYDAHYKAALRDGNLSTQVFINSFCGSQSFIQALCSALLSTGKLHAPIVETRQLLFGDRIKLEELIAKTNARIYGFGNQFVKDGIDPLIEKCVDRISSFEEWKVVEEVKDLIFFHRQKTLYPNIAAVTAAIAEHYGLPSYSEINLFIRPRMDAWISILNQ